jgi:hypothetical protein
MAVLQLTLWPLLDIANLLQGAAVPHPGRFISMDTDIRHSVSSPCISAPLLEPKEPRAPCVILSPAKRSALVACLKSGTLYRHNGAWVPTTATKGEKRISGVTVADLARDGLLSLDIKRVSAQLTVRGSWFARTAVDELTMGRARSQEV